MILSYPSSGNADLGKSVADMQWRTGSKNIGCQETKGAHPQLLGYNLIFIRNK
jgi:hypothetical protein